MPIETNPQTPADLDITWPRDLDVVREGAAHIRNLKQVIQQLEAVGTIKLFYGSVLNIAPGWAVCDGQNGTPDMRGRFPVGAGGAYALDAIGGLDSVTLTEAQIPSHGHVTATAGAHSHGGATASDGSHSHTTGTAGSHNHSGSANSAGSHSHSIRTDNAVGPDSTVLAYNSTNGAFGKDAFNVSSKSGAINSGGAHTHSLSINSNGNHTHTVSTAGAHTHTISSDGGHTHTVENTGGGGSHENRPPYRALYFIMKIE